MAENIHNGDGVAGKTNETGDTSQVDTNGSGDGLDKAVGLSITLSLAAQGSPLKKY